MKKTKDNLFWILIAAIPSFILGLGIVNGTVFDVDEIYTTTGEWAFFLMVLVLSLTPIRVIFKLNVNHLYQPLGLSVAYYVALHLGAYLIVEGVEDIFTLYILAGLAASVIYLMMALTSNKFSQKKLKKNWKRLHRLTFLATIFVLAHVILQEKIDLEPYAISFGGYAILYIAMKFNPKPKKVI